MKGDLNLAASIFGLILCNKLNVYKAQCLSLKSLHPISNICLRDQSITEHITDTNHRNFTIFKNTAL